MRRSDRDRFLTALFATSTLREHLYSLYAFNIEVSKTREVVSEAMLGAIRLQWWREAIEAIYDRKPARQHAVVQALEGTINACSLDRVYFERLINGRMLDLETSPPSDLAALLDYADATSGCLIILALQALGEKVDEALRQIALEVGRAWSIVGMIRAMPYQLRRGWIMLPDDLVERYGVDRRAMLDLKPSPELAAATKALSEEAMKHLVNARSNRRGIARSSVPALLPAILADTYLKRLQRAQNNVFDSRLAEPPGIATIRLAVAAILARY
ncbi:MAG: phytoene/squalene synthase family protein [Pseudomonadota bacterium]|nr:phytoene/squalene synthase family protein [Pseudomonadota bacterium]